MPYEIPDPLPWAHVAGPLAAAEDALARLDERLRTSPVRAGWNSRTHYNDACASLWLEGQLVHLEDLVLHDAGMDIRTPTHELTRAHAVLRARRRIAGADAGWALSPTGLAALRGRSPARGNEGEGGGPRVDHDAEETSELSEGGGDEARAGEFAAIDAVLERTQRRLDAASTPAIRPRDPLVYDPDWDEDRQLAAWRAVVDATRALPPLLAAALLWDAWETLEPLPRQTWLGALLVAATLRARAKTAAHLACLNVGLRTVARERRRARDRTTRLRAGLEAALAAANAGLKEHDRLLLARGQLMRALRDRRATSRLPQLVEFVLAQPLVSAALIAKELAITPRAAQNLVAELGLREATGRGRYRAWAV